MRIDTVKITKADREKCEEFANASVDSSLNHYKRRKQGNRDKIIQDITTGKLGEIAAYRLLRRNGIYSRQPDFEIYDARGKSFDADLGWKEYNFHCKAQNEDSANKYGVSWILQWGGKGHGHVDKLFKRQEPTDYLIPSLVRDDCVDIFGCIRVSTLFDEGCIKAPAVKWLEDCKRAIYLEDIRDLRWRDRWNFLNDTPS
jgi:hypothetical protein